MARYRVDPGVFDRVPEFVRAVVVVRDADNSRVVPDLRRELDRAVEDAAITADRFGDHPRALAWQRAYERAGIPVRSNVQPSFVALRKRIARGASISYISPLVCISNLVALESLTPSGVVDLGRVKNDVALTFATGDEVFEPLGGGRAEATKIGDLIYVDESSRRVLCSAWNSRGGVAGMVQSETTEAAFDIDWLGPDRTELHRAVERACERLRLYCGALLATSFLDASHIDFEI